MDNNYGQTMMPQQAAPQGMPQQMGMPNQMGMPQQMAPQGMPMQGMQQPMGMQPQMGMPNQMGMPQQMAPQGMMQQPMGMQPQMGMPNQMMNQAAPKAAPKVNVGEIKDKFVGNVKKTGISTYCLIGIIAAMLMLVTPFLNFAKVSFSGKVVGTKIKAHVGLDLFELSKTSNTVDRAIDDFGVSRYKSLVTDAIKDIKSDDIKDLVKMAEAEINDELDFDDFDDYYGGFSAPKMPSGKTKLDKGAIKGGIGTVYLVLKGKLPLLLAPWLILISAIGLFVSAVIANKLGKIIFSAIPLVMFVWILLCSKFFFSMMGLGAISLVVASALGILSAVKNDQ